MRYLQRTLISLLILTALSFSALAAKTESAVPHEINLAQVGTTATRVRIAFD